MDSKICFILIGIIMFTDGRPATQDSAVLIGNEKELQQLLKSLYSNGKFDLSFTHHEDGPKSHHEDTARISVHDKHSHHHHHDAESHDHSHGETHKLHQHTDDEDNPSLTNIQTLNLFLRDKAKNGAESDNGEDIDLTKLRSGSNYKNEGDMDQIIELLNELGLKVGADNRCGGHRCGRGRSNDDSSDNDDLDETERGPNNPTYREENGNNERIACIGDMCGRIELNSGDSEDRDDTGDDDRNYYNNGKLRCFGDACGRASYEVRADCVGDRCGRGREDYYNDHNDVYENKNIARCYGEACGIEGSLRGRRLPEGDKHIEELFQKHAQKIKVNDDVDALVLDLGELKNDFENKRAKDQNDNEQSKVQSNNNIDLSNLLKNINDNEEESDKGQGDSESKPLKTFVVDLSKTQNDLTNQINSLIRNLQASSKQNKPTKDQSSKDSSLPYSQSRILAHNEENNNVYVPKWLLDEVIAKTNLRESEQSLKRLLPLTAKQKERLGKAIAQKNKTSKRIFRRSIENEVGVPFHLQIEGLSQVEA